VQWREPPRWRATSHSLDRSRHVSGPAGTCAREHVLVGMRGGRFRYICRPKVRELMSVVCRYAIAPAHEARVPAQRGEHRVGIQGIDVQE